MGGAEATGDDTAGTDDEDGVTALSPTAWTEGPGSGTTNTLRVVVNGTLYDSATVWRASGYAIK